MVTTLVRISRVLLMVCAAVTTAQASSFEMYVASYANDRVLRYNSLTGVTDTMNNGAGGLTRPEGVAVGPDGQVYVATNGGSGGNRILKYDPRLNAFSSVFASSNLTAPAGIAFGDLIIPEPGTALLLALGGGLVLAYRHRSTGHARS